jgi:hypothetical protein
VALTKSEKNAARKAERLERAEARREATAEVMEARMRTAIGFGGTYLATQVLPNFLPSMAEHQATIDLAIAAVGGYFAVTDEGPFGDYATGAALVGATQTLDTVSSKINEWMNAA